MGPSPSAGCMEEHVSAVPGHSRKEEIASVREDAGGFLDLSNAHVWYSQLSLRRQKVLNTFLFFLSGKKTHLEGAFYSLWNGFIFTWWHSYTSSACQLFNRKGEIKQFRKIISGPCGNV